MFALSPVQILKTLLKTILEKKKLKWGGEPKEAGNIREVRIKMSYWLTSTEGNRVVKKFRGKHVASRRESTTSRKLTSPEAKKEGAKEPGTQRAGPRSRHPWRSGRGAHTRKVTVLFRETSISSSWAAGASDTTLEIARPKESGGSAPRRPERCT